MYDCRKIVYFVAFSRVLSYRNLFPTYPVKKIALRISLQMTFIMLMNCCRNGLYLAYYMTEFVSGKNKSTDSLLLQRMKSMRYHQKTGIRIPVF